MARGRKDVTMTWWCNAHRREATHADIRLNGNHVCYVPLTGVVPVCDPQLGGIMIPCNATDLNGEAEVVRAILPREKALLEAARAAWDLGHTVYHNANDHVARNRDWPQVRDLLKSALAAYDAEEPGLGPGKEKA